MSEQANPDRLETEHYRIVLEGVQDAIIVTDSEGNVMYMNATAQSIHDIAKLTTAQRENLNLERYILDDFEIRTLDGDPVPEAEQPLIRALRGDAYRGVELLVRCKDQDEPRMYVFSGTRIDDDPLLGVLTIRDETDKWQARRDYQQANLELTYARSRLAAQREQERMRLAQDLHDGVVQNLLAFSAQLGLEEQRHRQDGDIFAAEACHRHRAEVLRNVVQLRQTVRGLRPAALHAMGLWTSLREALPDVPQPGRPEFVLPTGPTPDLPEGRLLALYQVTLEAIRNAVRHADAARVEVTLDVRRGETILRVEDDGKGFEVPERLSLLAQEDRFGLLGAEERISAQGGTLDVESTPGEGTRVTCRVPA